MWIAIGSQFNGWTNEILTSLQILGQVLHIPDHNAIFIPEMKAIKHANNSQILMGFDDVV
jgi:hypothetical protein